MIEFICLLVYLIYKITCKSSQNFKKHVILTLLMEATEIIKV